MADKSSLMNIGFFFDIKNASELTYLFKELLKEYTVVCNKKLNTDTMLLFLWVSIHYIVNYRSDSERNIETLFKLLGAAQKDPQTESAYFSLLEKEAKNYPQDDNLRLYVKLQEMLAPADIQNLYDFFEWIIYEDITNENAEALLGRLLSIRYLYAKRIGTLHRFGKKKKSVEIPEEIKRIAQEFLEEYTPEKIKAYLDRFIIGQDEAKKNVSLAVYNHHLRIRYPEKNLLKTNMVLVGPSGSGKTEIIRRLMEIVKLPIIISDFSGIVGTPWKGRNKEDTLIQLLKKAGDNLALAQCGIVFCDEFDKIIANTSTLEFMDINMELQGQLLGMFEGTDLDLPINPKESISMNTKDILFVCAGAFEGLEEIVQKDMPEHDLAFGMTYKKKDATITQENIRIEHLIKYGMKPELAGRLGAISILNKLKQEDIRRILTEAEDSILKRYENEFYVDEKLELEFTEEAIDRIVEQIMEMKLGARSINVVLRGILSDALFDAPDYSYNETRNQRVVITKEVVEKKEKAQFLS